MAMTKETFRAYLVALDNVDAEALATRFYHRDFSREMGGETLDLAGLLDFEKSLKSVAEFTSSQIKSSWMSRVLRWTP